MARQRRPSLPDRERPARPFGRWARRVGLGLVVVAAGVLAFPQARPAGNAYRVGDIVRQKVVAPFDFHVRKDEAVLAREREAAALAIPPVVTRDSRIDNDSHTRLVAFSQDASAIVARGLEPAERTALLRQLGAPLPAQTYEAMSSPARASRILSGALGPCRRREPTSSRRSRRRSTWRRVFRPDRRHKAGLKTRLHVRQLLDPY